MYMIDGSVDLGWVSAGSSSMGLYYTTVLYCYTVLDRLLCREGLMIGNRGWWLTIYRMLLSYMGL